MPWYVVVLIILPIVVLVAAMLWRGQRAYASGASMKPVTVELSHQAAVFFRATVRHMNQRKILPPDDAQALETSAWLEEIEAKLTAALDSPPRGLSGRSLERS